MPVDLQTFLNALTSTGLMSEAEVAELKSSQSRGKSPTDVKELARELVRQQKLTPFQARAIYHGMSKSLVVGSYVILDRVGAGGMGQVYKAQHRRMKRVIAIKILTAAKVKSEETLRRFQREVYAAAKLNHPNIVTAHDANVEGGTHYLVMEFVEGCDLHSVVKNRGPIPAVEAVDWILQAAEGLKYAHERGVVHRDIKPGNLLLDVNNCIKILDMGLARLDEPGQDDADGPLTQMGEIIGTIDFMSPEQAEDTRQADARSDVYSLGCTLYYLLTGEYVYPADTVMKKLLAHRQQPAPALDRPEKSFDKELNQVYQRMVAKAPSDRYQTMGEVVEALWTCQKRLGPLPPEYATRVLPPATKPESFDVNLDLAPDDEVATDADASTQQRLKMAAPGGHPADHAPRDAPYGASDTCRNGLACLGFGARGGKTQRTREGKSQAQADQPDRRRLSVRRAVRRRTRTGRHDGDLPLLPGTPGHSVDLQSRTRLQMRPALRRHR